MKSKKKDSETTHKKKTKTSTSSKSSSTQVGGVSNVDNVSDGGGSASSSRRNSWGAASSSGEVSVGDYLQGNEAQYANINALSRLKRTDPLEWTVQDVGNWLDYIHLSEHRPEFMRQLVSGQELQELDQDDLISLGVTKVPIVTNLF